MFSSISAHWSTVTILEQWTKRRRRDTCSNLLVRTSESSPRFSSVIFERVDRNPHQHCCWCDLEELGLDHSWSLHHRSPSCPSRRIPRLTREFSRVRSSIEILFFQQESSNEKKRWKTRQFSSSFSFLLLLIKSCSMMFKSVFNVFSRPNVCRVLLRRTIGCPRLMVKKRISFVLDQWRKRRPI